MLGILRKDYRSFALGSLVFPAVLLTEILVWRELRLASLMTNLVLTWLVALVPLMINETEEERSGGYLLMGALPVLTREIVAAKHLLFLGAVAVCASAHLAYLAVAPATPALRSTAQLTTLLNSAACLVGGAVAYTGIFGLGFARFTVVALMCSTALGLGPPILLTIGSAAARKVLRGAAAFLLSLHVAGVVLFSLTIYALLFVVSVALFNLVPKKKSVPWM